MQGCDRNWSFPLPCSTAVNPECPWKEYKEIKVMKVEIKQSTSPFTVPTEYVTLRTVWNERDIIEIEFEDKKFKVDGYALIDSINRLVGRGLYNTD